MRYEPQQAEITNGEYSAMITEVGGHTDKNGKQMIVFTFYIDRGNGQTSNLRHFTYPNLGQNDFHSILLAAGIQPDPKGAEFDEKQLIGTEVMITVVSNEVIGRDGVVQMFPKVTSIRKK